MGIRVYTENDFLTPISINQDDNYTGGFKTEVITNLASPIFEKRILNPLGWVPVLQSFSFTVTVYTPNHLEVPDILYNERPYASYRSWNIGAAFTNNDRDRLGYELSLGSVGRPLAGDLQTKIHEEGWFGTTRPIPQGWRYEVAEGGVFAANLRVNYEHRLFPATASTRSFQWINGSWMHETNIGQVHVNYWQGVRLYLINYHHEVPGDEDLPIIAPAAPKSDTKFGFYFFVTPRLKAVLHNTTLSGQLLGKKSVHTIRPVEVNKALLEYDAGVQLRFCCLRLGYSIFGRTREYKNEAKSVHHWGGIYAGLIAKW